MINTALQVAYALLGSLGFGLLFNVGGSALPLSALGGGVGWGTFLAVSALSGRKVLAFFLASAVLSVYAEAVAHRRGDPVTIYLVPALIPLVPGSGMYYTVYEVIQGNPERATALFLETFSIAFVIALGVALASSMAALVRRARK
ncbi:MAG: threonine/serine exporter [Spirochaetes bacterium]|nr:MAG: threonine/serine exporter [Spirochaetota bacterium]